LTFQCGGTLTVPVIEIDLLYSPDCPNRSLARAHLDEALASTGLAALVREQEIRTSEEAARLGMRGSPTILIDGRDPFGAAAGSTVLSCRLYDGEAGYTGAPKVEQLIEVLAGHLPQDRS
jgi:hypothetical protein